MAAVPTASAESPTDGQQSLSSAGTPGTLSLEGRMALAETDRRFQQQQPAMSSTVNAVDDLGLDPTGNTPVNGTLGSALSDMSNTRVVFPKGGTFALSGHVAAIPEGPIEIVGNGCSFVIPPGMETKSLTLVLPGGSSVRDITIDQRAQGALQELSIQSSGVIRVDNVTVKGYAPAKPSSSDGGGVDSMFSPIARTSEATVRVTNFQAVGGTAAGSHDNDSLPADSWANTYGAPMGIWVGQSNQGTIQLANLKLRGWSNGIYGGRTPGVVEMYGGLLVNNFNGNARLGGGSVVDGASILLDDRQWSDKGPFKIGKQGVYAARVDAAAGGNQTDPITFKNLRVKAMSMRAGASLFEWESESGPGVIRNCHITNHLDRPVITGRPPSAPAATNVLVEQCRIDGKSSAAIMEMEGRPQSMIRRTCVTTRGAGPDDINGAQIGPGVNFGSCTSESGLAAPKKVGSGGNLSSLPAPATGGTGGGAGMGSGIAQAWAAAAQQFVLIVLLIIALVAFIAILPLWLLYKLLF